VADCRVERSVLTVINEYDDESKTTVVGSRPEKNGAVVCINETMLDNVERFVCLGSEFTWNNACPREIRRKIQLVTGAYDDLQPIWKDKGLSTEIKIQLIQTCVFELLLYAAETWTTKKADQRRLLAFEIRCYRHILEVNGQNHISNNEVR